MLVRGSPRLEPWTGAPRRGPGIGTTPAHAALIAGGETGCSLSPGGPAHCRAATRLWRSLQITRLSFAHSGVIAAESQAPLASTVP